MFPILQFAEGSTYSHKMHNFTVSTWEYGDLGRRKLVAEE